MLPRCATYQANVNGAGPCELADRLHTKSPHSGDELAIFEFYTRLPQGYPTILHATESTLQALAERT
jgi:hypothetical protein